MGTVFSKEKYIVLVMYKWKPIATEGIELLILNQVGVLSENYHYKTLGKL